jgi:membrane protein implicated in regulation of membrane protease activity
MITAGRMMTYPGEFWVGMGIFAIVSFLALMTEIYWRKRIEWEQEDIAIWEDLFYALEGEGIGD